MKTLLLTLLALACASAAPAREVTVSFADNSGVSYLASTGHACDWTADDNTLFATVATAPAGTTYPGIYGGCLRLFTAPRNAITVQAPEGYVVAALTFTLKAGDQPVITVTAAGDDGEAGEAADIPTQPDGEAALAFASPAAAFTFNMDSEANTAAYYNIKAIAFTLEKATGLPAAAVIGADGGESARYYTLQGLPAAACSRGLLLRRQDGAARLVVR